MIEAALDEEDDWLYTLIGTAPPKPTVDKEIEERIINKKIPKAEDLGQYKSIVYRCLEFQLIALSSCLDVVAENIFDNIFRCKISLVLANHFRIIFCHLLGLLSASIIPSGRRTIVYDS